jgi:hypothetical protein
MQVLLPLILVRPSPLSIKGPQQIDPCAGIRMLTYADEMYTYAPIKGPQQIDPCAGIRMLTYADEMYTYAPIKGPQQIDPCAGEMYTYADVC